MTVTLKRSTIATLLGLAVLAGCGSTKPAVDIKAIAKGLFTKPKDAPAATVNVDAILAATDVPLTLVVLEKNKASTAMLQIAENGPYQTFSTSARQTISFRDGIMTSTRGLSSDLMSTSASQSRALIAQRKAGQATRIMRFLDGADKTASLQFTCAVSVGATQAVNVGEVSGTTLVVTEACKNEDRSFTNTYLVDKAGRVLGSRQWAGPGIEYIQTQPLRL
ncbi:MAG: YjbF family lipoprotein [Thalassovita sp.]